MPYKVKRPPKSYDIEVLSAAVRQLTQECRVLETQNSYLSLRHSLLAATCDILQMLGAIKQAGDPSTAEAELLVQLRAIAPEQNDSLAGDTKRAMQDAPVLPVPASGADNESANTYHRQPDQQQQQRQQQEEHQLRPDQHSSGVSSSSSLSFRSNGSTGSSMQLQSLLDLQEDETLGTPQDPLRSLRLSLQQQHDQLNSGAEGMTLQDLQKSYQDTVNQLAQHLAFLDNPFRRRQKGAGNPFEMIKRLLTRQGRLLTSLLVSGQAHLVPAFLVSDVTTGEQLQELSDELYDYAAQRLGLSQEQQERMQAILLCYQGLLNPIVEQRQALQQQLQLPAAGLSTTAGLSASGSSNKQGSTPSSVANSMGYGMLMASADGGGHHAAVSKTSKEALSHQQQAARQQQEHKQQQLAEMLKLLKKESLLKGCTWVGIEGCCTWVQLAKLATCCYPYPASPLALAQAVDRKLQQQQLEPQALQPPEPQPPGL